MESMISFVKVMYKSSIATSIADAHIDDVFVAVTNSNDISSIDLHEISLKMSSDPQQSTARRNQSKKNGQSSVDCDTSTTGPSIVNKTSECI